MKGKSDICSKNVILISDKLEIHFLRKVDYSERSFCLTLRIQRPFKTSDI